MGVVNVACPYCGQQALATVPSSEFGVTYVRQNSNHSGNDSTTACQECGKYFGYEYNKL